MSERLQTAGEKITDDDATIAAALEDLSVPALMMSMVHMTGDTSILDGPLRPLGLYINEVQGFMPEEQQAQVRAQALEIIKAYRDGGCKLPPMPDNDTIRKMMCFMVAGDVPQEYVPMMLEEMELDGVDAREFHWSEEIPDRVKQGFHVVVIGGGMSGLLAAIRLGEAGIPYTVIEKNAGVGGTWYENTYPGCRVDVGNHFYCYSFEPNHDWSEFYSQQHELRDYFEGCADKYGTREHTRFETEVVAARFDESSHRWAVRIRTAAGEEEVLEANAIISAVGQLNRPKRPDIPGRDSFAGPAMHTAAWQHEHDLTGKRVAVIGTGASAFQLVPAIAEQVDRLFVFQRSAPWMFPNPNYHRAVGDGVKWALRHLPYYGRWFRFLIFWPACDALLPTLHVDPDWPHQDRSINAGHDGIRQVFTDYLKEQVGDDEELLAKVTPDYAVLGKRTLQDNGSWLTALKRDDVELITDPVAEITEDAVVCENGDRYPVDVIVYATGFHANRYLWPMEITGRSGVTLAEQWGDDPSALLGITVPNFPNLFCVYGPGTNLAFGGSLIFHSECQVTYAMSGIQALLENEASAIECSWKAHDEYNRRLQQELSDMVWSHPSIENSWYQNRDGKVTILSPWRLLDYWQWTGQVDLDDYVLAGSAIAGTSKPGSG
jgi:4-hydroxyacetophenone monooxygenase